MSKVYVSKCLFFYLLGYGVLVIYSCPFSFFSDNILQSSAVAHFYYKTHFTQFILPDNLDAGHPPFFGMLLAVCWKLFGKHLWVGHIMMLPFAWGIVWQTYRLVSKFVSEKWQWLAMAFVLADASILSQCTQVSPDVGMLFFLLLGINAVLKQENTILTLAGVGILLFNIRGIVLASELFFFYIAYNYVMFKRVDYRKVIACFLPVFLLGVAYYGYHFYEKGWIRYHESSSWETEVKISSFKMVLYKFGIAIWRLIDFGRIGLWILLAYLVFLLFGKRQMSFFADKKLNVLCLILISNLVIIVLLIFSSEFLGHRYLMGINVSVSLLATYLLFEKAEWKESSKFLLGVGIISFLIIGNFFIYPRSISKGWDCTLAHIPYFNLKREMIKFIESRPEIRINEIGSDFPNDMPIYLSELNNDTSNFPTKDFSKQRYILYSNVYNGFTDNELLELDNQWHVVKKMSSGMIEMVLYKKNEILN